ncbi:MAG: low specificity L-threonine aldolase [Xenococcaceae cyanobacterium]
MNFSSDNITGCSPEIITALLAANEGAAMPYGDDECTQRLNPMFSQLFQKEVEVFPVTTGTAANALALSTITPSFGVIYCHNKSHIYSSECGAIEFHTGGARLVTIPGEHGKISSANLAAALAQAAMGVNAMQPAAVSITQATEAGTVYRPEEIQEIAKIVHTHNLSLHMDGARFANAVDSLGCSPAEITWKVGVDVLSFGATKNGAIAAEAVVFFNPSLAETFSYRRKRSGHLLSKMRFLSAQLDAYITDDLWLRNARHANQMAAKLSTEIAAIPGIELIYPVEVNEIFIRFPKKMSEGLLAEGFRFYHWEEGEEMVTARIVTAFNTREAECAAFVETAKLL